MKDAFMASFFHEGILGGAIYLQRDKVRYRTDKLQLEPRYRDLEIPYNSIAEMKTGWALCFPTVTLVTKSGISYRFIVFHRRKFLSRLDELRK